MALRLYRICCGVIVAATFSPWLSQNATASPVVMCSITIFSPFTARGPSHKPRSVSSRKTRSRSNTSTDACVTSPCTSSTRPHAAIASSAPVIFDTSVTPKSLLVVAPAGYSLHPRTKPDAAAASMSAALVLSVRYRVICGSNATPSGTAARIWARYSAASCTVRTGGTRFGIISARPNARAVKGTTEAIFDASRTCRCQSSGVVMVSSSAEAAAARPRRAARTGGRREAARRARRAAGPRGRLVSARAVAISGVIVRVRSTTDQGKKRIHRKS